MRVLIVVPRFIASTDEFYQFPLGLAYIASAVKTKWSIVYGLNLNHVFGNEQNIVADYIQKYAIDICLTGSLSPFLKNVQNIFTGAREGNRDVINIAGGGVVSSDPEIALDLMDIDVGIVGEGEQTIVDLLDCLSGDGRELYDVEGIVYRNQSHEIIQTKPRKVITDLDRVHWPDYDLFGFGEYLNRQRPLDTYLFQTHTKGTPRCIDMISSRSCPFSCTFCFHPVGKVYRERPLDDFFNELEYYINKYKVNMVNVMDELFSLRKARLLEFCERIKPMNLLWMVQLHVRTADQQVLDAMKDSGAVCISFGIESANEAVLESMAKKSTRKQINLALNNTNDRKIGIQGNLIFGDKAETLATANDTMHWWAQHREYQIYLSRIQIFPGSPDYHIAVQSGVIRNRLTFSTDLPVGVNMSSMSNQDWLQMFFQLKVHGRTLLRWPKNISFKPSFNAESTVDGCEYDIIWSCPDCGFNNAYERTVLQPEHRYFIRMFCRCCLSRWDVENIFYNPPEHSAEKSMPWDISFDHGSTLLQDVWKTGNLLLNHPFSADKHFRFANALVFIGAHGAAWLHFTQAKQLMCRGETSSEMMKVCCSKLKGIEENHQSKKHIYFVPVEGL